MRRSSCPVAVCMVVAWVTAFGCAPDEDLVAAEQRRPNILLLVADDLGFSDIGAYGGEIRTPHLDALAERSLLLTNFYTAPACKPTRAMLMTGVDSHLTGAATMFPDSNQIGKPGYEGILNQRVVTMATLLKDAGYRTAMVGKWGLGMDETSRPSSRGFERAFASPSNLSHFSDQAPVSSGQSPYRHTEDDRPAVLPENFYTSRHYTDKLIEYLEDFEDSSEPFFAYAAYTAPHWPLQVPDEYAELYRGEYDDGYDRLRAGRVESVKQRSLIPGVGDGAPRLGFVPAWDSLSAEKQRYEARRMEIYAAMVERLDHHIGRLLDYLEARGELDNTFVVFFSDNGAEGGRVTNIRDNATWIPENFDNSYENMGRLGSYIDVGPGWAQASSAPFNFFKMFASEGGIHVPALVHLPGVKIEGVRDQVMTVMDVLPTVLELAGVSHPGSTYDGREVHDIQGRSAFPYLRGDSESIHGRDPVLGWEFLGRRAIRKGTWKMTRQGPPYGEDRWKLFNLAEDPSETHDLSVLNPERLRELEELWDEYVAENGVILPTKDMGWPPTP